MAPMTLSGSSSYFLGRDSGRKERKDCSSTRLMKWLLPEQINSSIESFLDDILFLMLTNNFIEICMIEYRQKLSNKLAAPFPLSAYVLRSYSSEPADHPRPKHRAHHHQSDREQQEFYGLVKGWGLKDNDKQLRAEKELTPAEKELTPAEKELTPAEKELTPAEKELMSEIKNRSTKSVKHDAIQQSRSRLAETQSKIRKNLYRTRERKGIYATKSVAPAPKKKSILQNRALQAFYRNQLVSLLTLLGRKEDYINSLRGKGELLGSPMKLCELQDKLSKQLESKGRDKGRQKFNHFTNQQLRSIKYKSKQASCSSPSKKEPKAQNDEDAEEQEGDVEERVEKVDLQTWKRRNGVGFYQKVFIIKGGYAELRKALVEKGWYENEDVWSPHFDFKWTTKIGDINFLSLKNNQAVNHFNNNHHLTSKYGITRRLRTLILGHNVDVDKFYPRCYDLGDQVDFENFVENFKFGFAESVARRFLVDKKRYEGLELKIRITVDILSRRTLRFSHKLNEINKGNFLTISPEEWEIITETAKMEDATKEQKLRQYRSGENSVRIELAYEDPEYEAKLYEVLDERVRSMLEQLKKWDPQIEMNGFRNVWIVKPNFMSRGRGIRCFNNLYDIADYCLGREVQFVAQKYIEHPLVMQGKKFDIRQWVLIQDYNPPKIWFYDECYVRFCADDFSLDNIYNRYIHLTNNSIQKYNKKGNIDKSMWTMTELADAIGPHNWLQVQQKIKNIVVWSIKSCEGHVMGKKGSCELVGYDFMIDQELNPWLIEINMSPSMDYSTPVTKKLVKMVLADTAKVISSNKKNRDTGGFQCIYQGDQDLANYNAYSF